MLFRSFGGCAGNIAYNLQRLGGDPLIMATVGDDYAPYGARLDALGLARKHVREVKGTFTAQAFITTDLDDNQITAFHPGAMNRAGEVGLGDAPASLGIVSPNGREAMIRHAREFSQRSIRFIFDPGQAMPIFSREDLEGFVSQATWVAVNDYEGHMLAEKLSTSIAQLASRQIGRAHV